MPISCPFRFALFSLRTRMSVGVLSAGLRSIHALVWCSDDFEQPLPGSFREIIF